MTRLRHSVVIGRQDSPLEVPAAAEREDLADILTGLAVPSPSKKRAPQYNAYGDLIDRDENMWLRQWHVRQERGSGELEQEPRARTTASLNEYGDLVDSEENRWLRQWFRDNKDELARNVNNSVMTKAEEWRRGRGALLRVCAIVVLSLPVWFSANAFLPDIMAESGFDKKQGSLLTVAVNIGFVCATTLSTFVGLADRVSAARLVAAGTLLCGLFSGALIIDLPLVMTLTARFMTGAAIALIYPVLLKYLSTWFSALRGLAMGCLIASFTVGAAVPNFVKAVLPLAPWRWAILVPTGLAMIGSVLATCLVPGPTLQRQPAVGRVTCKALLQVVRNRRWLLVTLSYMGHSFELYGGWAWIGAFLLEYFQGKQDSEESWAPLATFAVIAIGSVGCVTAGALADRFGRIVIISVSHSVSGLCIAALPFLSSTAPPGLVLATAGLWGLTVNADSAQYSAMVTEVVDAPLVSTAVTLSIALGFIMTAIAVYVVPVFVDDFGWKGAFLSLAVGPLLGLFAILCARM